MVTNSSGNTAKTISLMASMVMCSVFMCAQHPRILVDLNIQGRSESEVNEPGYLPWPATDNGDVLLSDGTTFTLTGNYSGGWYKAGVQAPYYARLANDGIRSSTGFDLVIGGLPKGPHSLLTIHNTFDNPETNTFSPMDIFLNDSLVADNLVRTNRVPSNDRAAMVYLEFTAVEGEDVVVTFVPETNTEASQVTASLCGFELNTPDARTQARDPFPADGDLHAPADSGQLVLGWSPGPGAVARRMYFGQNATAVAEADTASGTFKGTLMDTLYSVEGLYSMQDYYWRVDEVDSAGKVTRGDTWHFRPRQTAFPGAGGHGKYALGGRGGQVVFVTNLNDDGPGSLREAVASGKGPRTIIFSVSGIITLKSRLTLTDGRVTVAGQTAPGKGICIRRAPFGLSGAEDVIVRHMRVRVGSGDTYDGMGMAGSDHSILDHCSVSWTIDEGFSSRNARNITLQNSLISEALNVAGHENYPDGTRHGYAASIGGDIGSFHHNLLAHCEGRNWSLAGGLDGNGEFAGRLDIFNNVVYNWNSRVTDGGAHEVNFVNNYYRPGPATGVTSYALKAEYENFPGTQQYYFAGNIMEGYFNETNQEDGRRYTGSPQGYEPWVDAPFFPSWAPVHPAREAFRRVLSGVGATQPALDDHDLRVIRETLEGTHTYSGSRTGLPGLPDSEQDVGGWEEYPAFARSSAWDRDLDGMPDWWESARGLDPASDPGDLSETHADPDRNGYTHLEEYLHWMAAPHRFAGPGEEVLLKVPEYFRGYSGAVEYAVDAATNGEAVWENDTVVRFTPASAGLGSLALKATVQDAMPMFRVIGIYSGMVPADSAVEDPSGRGPEPGAPPVRNLTCYPNPATHEIFLKGDLDFTGPVKVHVIDPAGKVLASTSMVPSATRRRVPIDLAPFEPGIYLLRLVSGKENAFLKFVKCH